MIKELDRICNELDTERLKVEAARRLQEKLSTDIATMAGKLEEMGVSVDTIVAKAEAVQPDSAKDNNDEGDDEQAATDY